MLDYAQEHIGAWTLAGLSGVVAGLRLHDGRRGFGFGLMTVPLWSTFLGILASIAPLVAGGTVLAAASRYDLSSQYMAAILPTLGYLGTGFLLYSTRWHALSKDIAGLARDLGRLVPMGRSESASAAVGYAVVPLLAAGNLLLGMLTASSKALNNGDDSQFFTNMTVYHAFMISAAAALGEELLFRGLLQGLLMQAFRPLGKWPGAILAIVPQAIFFGFAHAGYGNFAHVLFPGLFGLLAGFLCWRYGLWSGIVLHFFADFYLLGLEAGSKAAWVASLVNVLFLANLVFAAAFAFMLLRKRKVVAT